MPEQPMPIAGLSDAENASARAALVDARNALLLFADDLTRYICQYHEARCLGEKEDAIRAAIYLLSIRLVPNVRLDRLAQAQASIASAAAGVLKAGSAP